MSERSRFIERIRGAGNLPPILVDDMECPGTALALLVRMRELVDDLEVAARSVDDFIGSELQQRAKNAVDALADLDDTRAVNMAKGGAA